MVYQEQVMLAAQRLAGYSLGGADILRKAMGKKNPVEMAKQRGIFRDGCGEARTSRKRSRRRGLRPDGEVRRLRLQQVARGRVLAARLPHRMDQGALHRRVLRRQPDGGDADDTDKLRVLADRREELRRGAACRPTSIPVCIASSRSRIKFDPVRPGRDQRHRVRARSRRSSRPATEGGAFTSLFDFCARVDRKQHEQARRRSARQSRRVRCAARRSRAACSRAWVWRWTGPTRRPHTLTRVASSTSAPTVAPAMARARRSPPLLAAETLEHQGAAHPREKLRSASTSRATCSTRAPTEVRRFAKRQHRRPARQPRAAVARRHRQRFAHRQRPARARRDLQARRQDRDDRGGRERRPVECEQASC